MVSENGPPCFDDISFMKDDSHIPLNLVLFPRKQDLESDMCLVLDKDSFYLQCHNQFKFSVIDP